MKKIFLTTLSLTLFLSITYSQEYFSKGSNILTGGINIGLSDNNTEYDDRSSITEFKTVGFSSNYGKFIKTNLAIGFGLGYSKRTFSSTKFLTDSTFNKDLSENKTISAELFLRKYFPVNEKFGAYFNTKLYYNLSDNSRVSYDELEELRNDESISNRAGLSAGLGLYYFIFDRLSLSLNLGYIGFSASNEKAKNDRSYFQEASSKSFNVNFVNQISFDQLLTINYHF